MMAKGIGVGKARKCIVASCLVIKDGRLLLIKHKKLGVWIPPGGHVERDEFPSEAAIRETKEETGIDVKIIGEDRVIYRSDGASTEKLPFTIVNEDVPYRDGRHNHFDIVYLAKPVDGSLQLNEEEATEIGWFNYDELTRLDTYTNIMVVAMNALRYAGAGL